MTAKQLRTKYLEFFESKGHTIIPSASLLPDNDPTVLFTTAGMQQLVPYFLGEKHPSGNKLTDVQKCVRMQDIEEIGDTSHDTFFEMLGNWSLGSYFKTEAIAMSWEFLTDKKWLNIDKQLLAVTVFEGDANAPRDEESAELWKQQGISEDKIAYMGKEDNWWGPAGETGPCGPDTEIFYWVGKAKLPPKNSTPDNDEDNWLEIWNNVFMEYNKTKDGKFEPLAQKNVDTGMGLERVLMVMNNYDDVFQTDVFWPIIEKVEEISGKSYGDVNFSEVKSDSKTTHGDAIVIKNEEEWRGVTPTQMKHAMRIITDHIRTATMILGDERGIGPSNTGAGYILRRLIRRAVRYGNMIGINHNFTADIASVVIEIYQNVYPELNTNRTFIKQQLEKEEAKFSITLEKGLKELNKLIKRKDNTPQTAVLHRPDFGSKHSDYINAISGKEAFNIYQTYGFPIELINEELAKHALFVHKKEFEQEFNDELKKHQKLSKTASAGMFKGGLADASDETKRLHTASHLMLEAMRQVLGDHVTQKGSNINAERLRFDFNHPEKLTEEQKSEVEDIVNGQIKKNQPVWFEEMTLDEARKLKATGVFDHKYGDKVKVYFIGKDKDNFSKEICGGPHVDNTSELGGEFKITKEQSSSSGIRRIKAIINKSTNHNE